MRKWRSGSVFGWPKQAVKKFNSFLKLRRIKIEPWAVLLRKSLRKIAVMQLFKTAYTLDFPHLFLHPSYYMNLFALFKNCCRRKSHVYLLWQCSIFTCFSILKMQMLFGIWTSPLWDSQFNDFPWRNRKTHMKYSWLEGQKMSLENAVWCICWTINVCMTFYGIITSGSRSMP